MIKPLLSWSWVQWAFVIFLGTVLLFVAFAGWQYWLFTGGVFRTSSFSEPKWKVLRPVNMDNHCYRGGMAFDLQANILLPGTTKTQVEALLGAPDFTNAGVAMYALGTCSGLQIDVDTLDVHFNAEDKVEKVLIVQH